MKLYVPEIGDKLKLTSDWTFDLHWEHRNAGLLKHFFGEEFRWKDEKSHRPVTLPKGTVITVDRIYIRQGASEYSSISFYAGIGETGKGHFGKPKNPRFWATLKDCNRIEFEIEESAPTLKLVYDYNVRDIKAGDYAGFCQRSSPGEKQVTYKGTCNRVITARDHRHIFNVTVEVGLEWKEQEHRSLLGLGGKSWYAIYGKPKYTLLSLDGKELGSWGTLASLKKNAKEIASKM